MLKHKSVKAINETICVEEKPVKVLCLNNYVDMISRASSFDSVQRRFHDDKYVLWQGQIGAGSS